MAGRGRKSYTLEEKYEMTIKNIEETKEYLQKMEEEKKELEIQIKTKRLEEIEKMIFESGKTLDEVKELLMN